MAWWQQTFDYARQIYSLTKSSTRHDTEIKELRDELKKLSASVQQLIFDQQRDRDRAEVVLQLIEKDRQMAAKDHELLLSRLETKLLQYERRLPPPASSEDVL
jgi:hypothetical protein